MIFHLHPDIFETVKNGKKDIEVRLNDEKRKKLKVGDKIIFLKRPLEKEKIEATVKDLKYFESLEEVVNTYDMERIYYPYLTKEEYINEMERYYSKDKQKQLKIVCIIYEKD